MSRRRNAPPLRPAKRRNNTLLVLLVILALLALMAPALATGVR
jgi:Tfp pilus assembly protein FimT